MSCLGSVFSFRGERLRSLPLAAEPFLAIESTLTGCRGVATSLEQGGELPRCCEEPCER